MESRATDAYPLTANEDGKANKKEAGSANSASHFGVKNSGNGHLFWDLLGSLK